MRALLICSALVLGCSSLGSPPAEPEVVAPVPVVAGCQCGVGCKCKQTPCPCTDDEYNALLQERIELQNRIADLEKRASTSPPVQTKIVCNSTGCRVVQAAAPVQRAVQTIHYRQEPVYGPLGRVRGYRSCSGGQCR